MINYYDELEVSKTASKEVIEKVYKVLAKKYHPDTTKEVNKQLAEEKFKIISEAYETLSNNEKRKKYDLELEQSNPTVSYEEYINVVNQRDTLNEAFNNLKNEIYGYRNQNNEQYYNNNYTQFNNNTSQDMNPNYNNSNTNSIKKNYYYTDTGEPSSVFEYYKYKIKEFISNISLLFFSIIIAIIIIYAFSYLSIFF